MVQIHFQAVTQPESRIALNGFAKHASDIRFKLVTASETNPNHLILDILRSEFLDPTKSLSRNIN